MIIIDVPKEGGEPHRWGIRCHIQALSMQARPLLRDIQCSVMSVASRFAHALLRGQAQTDDEVSQSSWINSELFSVGAAITYSTESESSAIQEEMKPKLSVSDELKYDDGALKEQRSRACCFAKLLGCEDDEFEQLSQGKVELAQNSEWKRSSHPRARASCN